MSAPFTRSQKMTDAAAPALRFVLHSTWARRMHEPGICDFAVGNPQEMPMPGFVEALQKWSQPQSKDWFAYTLNNPAAQEAVVDSLKKRLGQTFLAEDISMTTGAFGALAAVIETICVPDDEIIFSLPPWFFYEAMIRRVDAVPVKVHVQPTSFDLDLDAIAQAITPNTRAVLVNSPHNPTGKIYPADTLGRLAAILEEASQRNGRPIYLISDEAYSDIVFDGNTFVSPTAFYPNSFLIYTFGKVLLAPGQRVGYVALPPEMPDREQMRDALFAVQFFGGFLYPNALLQHAMGDLTRLSLDMDHLQRKRDRMVTALREAGYELSVPEGTFYLFVRSPWEDDEAFIELLTEYDIFCLPGAVVEMPGYFRISLTASDEMIDRAIPGFARAMEQAQAQEPQMG